jgi:nucleotide-binding universal stress UspA family protein
MAATASLFQNILAATGNCQGTDGTVMTAARLARRQQGRVRIVHAAPPVTVAQNGGHPASQPRPGAGPGMPGHPVSAQSLLALYAPQFPELRVDDVVLAVGVAWEAIFRTALQLGSDLIVVGPHAGAQGVHNLSHARGFLGSTADGVIRQARCPVMIANRAFEDELLEFTNIVVGVDFSVSCASALCLAALIARYYSAFISTFHMLPVPPYPKYTPQALQADRMRLQKRLNAICSLLLEDIGHQFFLKPGARPHEELLEFAEEFGADLIIMGSHTKEKAGKWYSGSVVQQVACQAACPVLVVNGLEALTPWRQVPFVSRCFAKAAPHLAYF